MITGGCCAPHRDTGGGQDDTPNFGVLRIGALDADPVAYPPGVPAAVRALGEQYLGAETVVPVTSALVKGDDMFGPRMRAPQGLHTVLANRQCLRRLITAPRMAKVWLLLPAGREGDFVKAAWFAHADYARWRDETGRSLELAAEIADAADRLRLLLDRFAGLAGGRVARHRPAVAALAADARAYQPRSATPAAAEATGTRQHSARAAYLRAFATLLDAAGIERTAQVERAMATAATALLDDIPTRTSAGDVRKALRR